MQFRKKRREKSPNYISVDLTRLVVHVNGKQIKKKKKKRKKDGEEERKKREKNNER